MGDLARLNAWRSAPTATMAKATNESTMTTFQQRSAIRIPPAASRTAAPNGNSADTPEAPITC